MPSRYPNANRDNILSDLLNHWLCGTALEPSMVYEDVVRDFALRTRRNLELVERLAAYEDEAYEITQLVNSMLGLLVFPQQRYVNRIPRTPLAEIEAQGWPVPKVRGNFRQVSDLNQLIRYLRNAIAHFNIEFIGDGQRQLAVLRVWNMAPLRDKHNQIVRDPKTNQIQEIKNWEAELSFADLRSITYRFIELIVAENAT